MCGHVRKFGPRRAQPRAPCELEPWKLVAGSLLGTAHKTTSVHIFTILTLSSNTPVDLIKPTTLHSAPRAAQLRAPPLIQSLIIRGSERHRPPPSHAALHF